MKFASSKSILIVLLVLGGYLLSGCTRCVTCDACPSGVQLESAEMCEDDFNSQEDFDQAVETAEGFGCSCSDS